MNNFTISAWTSLATQTFKEARHPAIAAIACHAASYAENYAALRARSQNLIHPDQEAVYGEVPLGYYIDGVGETWSENDKFFADLQFLYRHGWLVEHGPNSLMLAIGASHKVGSRTSASRRRNPITATRTFAVYIRDNFNCWLCGFDTLSAADFENGSPWAPSLDHVVPHSHGGQDTHENLKTAHRWCNTIRRDNLVISHQIMSARVNLRMSTMATLWEAREDGLSFPRAELAAFSGKERARFLAAVN